MGTPSEIRGVLKQPPKTPQTLPTPQLKDLRRQLQLERRRGERLQERLQELLVPSRARSGQGGPPNLGRGGSPEMGWRSPKILG